MATKIYTIPEKLDGYWIPEVHAIHDAWKNYSVQLSEFKEAVLVKGINHAKANKAHAWIVDSSVAKGVFSQDIQTFIGTDVFPTLAKNGIKYFITVLPQASAVTKLTVRNFSEKAGPNGLKLVEVNTFEDAVNWLKKN